MLIVVAIGGNALLHKDDALTAHNLRANIQVAAKALGQLIDAGHTLVITHGNGPQIGLLALQNESYKPDESYPLDILGAQTEGMIGYLIEQALENVLPKNRLVATLLTQVEVDANDTAFDAPVKPVGPAYNAKQARALKTSRGWVMLKTGDHYQRVVASPRPLFIPDMSIIQLLIENNVTVICAGGGGIPVVRKADDGLTGIQAVVDKDHTSCLLAKEIGADYLLILTNVEGVYSGWNTPDQSMISQATPDEIRHMNLSAGSMGPKVNAACDFADASGQICGIGLVSDALKIIEGRAGTRISQSTHR